MARSKNSKQKRANFQKSNKSDNPGEVAEKSYVFYTVEQVPSVKRDLHILDEQDLLLYFAWVDQMGKSTSPPAEQALRD